MTSPPENGPPDEPVNDSPSPAATVVTTPSPHPLKSKAFRRGQGRKYPSGQYQVSPLSSYSGGKQGRPPRDTQLPSLNSVFPRMNTQPAVHTTHPGAVMQPPIQHGPVGGPGFPTLQVPQVPYQAPPFHPLTARQGPQLVANTQPTTSPNSDPTQAHPHLRVMGFYINSFPPDMPEEMLAEALRDCMPIRIKLTPEVPEERRLLPDMHYDWMPRNGTVEFTTMKDTEKGLAILINHAVFSPRGVWVSPFPPPYILQLPDSPASTRYIRPTRLMIDPQLPPNPSTEVMFRAYFPTPAEVYEAVRPWGCLRSVNSYIHERTAEEGKVTEVTQGHDWMAKVEFWYEDEALRFETGFGQSASLLKGWQVYIHGNSAQMSAHSAASVGPYQVPPRMMPQLSAAIMPVEDNPPIHYLPPDSQSGNFSPQHIGFIPLNGSLPPTPITSHMPTMPHLSTGIMDTPSPINYVPPWAGHNMFAAIRVVNPDVYVDAAGVPISPRSMGRRMSRASMSSLSGRQRTWSLTVGETPDGELRPTGLVADDGTIIQHGPGQHIRPAPAHGPGSTSVSGLVDYSNIFVKNLDHDINSYYLEDIFSSIGQVVSARVMRDEQGRSRGYGFVSFSSPEQAAQAIALMHDTVFGRSRISVTLHEPRKLRSEKMWERISPGSPIASGRQASGLPRRSMSPVRTDYLGRGRETLTEGAKPIVTAEAIRLLSPDSRKDALTKRVSARVRAYALANDMTDADIEVAIEAIVKLNLSLVPLLHDKVELDKKIAEEFAKLKREPITTALPPSPVTPTRLVGETSSIRPTDEELVRLREEVSKIDPAQVDEIMPVLLEMLAPGDWNTLWVNSGVAAKYGLAKKILQTQDTEEEGKAINVPPPQTEAIDSQADDTPSKANDEAELVPIADLTIPSFASLPAKRIVSNLHHNEHGKLICVQLGLVQPSESDKAEMVAFLSKVMGKSKVARGIEVASLLAKKVEIDTIKRSQKLKLIKDVIQSEGDEEALCELTLYPALLNAKVQALMDV